MSEKYVVFWIFFNSYARKKKKKTSFANSLPNFKKNKDIFNDDLVISSIYSYSNNDTLNYMYLNYDNFFSKKLTTLRTKTNKDHKVMVKTILKTYASTAISI